MSVNTCYYASRTVFWTKTKVVPTTGLEPINGVFSPLPMLASFSIFIAHTVTRISNNFKYNLCLCGKSREEKRVQNVCKEIGCANFVQTKLAPESVQTCAKILACRGARPASGASTPSPGGKTPFAITFARCRELPCQRG